MVKRSVSVFGKTLAALLVLVLMAGAVGCGGAATGTSNQPAAATAAATTAAEPAPQTEADKPVALKMITWAQPTNLDAINALNAGFTKKYPNVTFTIDTVNANDYPTLEQTRVAAGDVDIITSNGPFDSFPQDFTKGLDKPAWATFIESGAFLDITGQPFLKNWDPAMIKDAATYKGKVYGLDMGKVGFSGVFYNKKMFDDNGLKEPGTWADMSSICKTLKAKGITPFTAGVKDGWPVNMLASGFVAAFEPDAEAYAKGLWTGTRKLNDEGSMKMWNAIEEWSSCFEKGVAAVDYGSAPGRFTAGKAAMMPDGTWNSGAIEKLDPNFQYGYFSIPGITDNKPNQLAGKYDIMFNIYAKTPNRDICLKWLDFLSQKENYTPLINALSMFPTMPDVQISNKFMLAMADKNKSFKLAFERVCLAPKGVGQYAAGDGFQITQLKAFGGTVGSVKELADLAQKDWEKALAAAK